MARKEKDLYGLIGRKLGHSFSCGYFNRKFESECIDAEYLNFEIDTIEELPALLAAHPALKGLNVTIPYKQDIMRYLDEVDPEAAKIGAVNVVSIRRKDGHPYLKGFNSDVVGFVNSIKPLLRPLHLGALVLGTGGASKAVARGLESLGLHVRFVSRTPREGVLTYADLTPAVMTTHTVVVNTTPLGMYPDVDACPPIPYDLLTSDHLCYDLIYNPDNTKFMREAALRGAVTKNGLEMLLLQAFETWLMWQR